mmetsp:Transcript_40712/g.125733  ORF Transcript_40712/g.125733 Transcript_40712/m.125733 type:complete len:204 (-) Transcript_40712:65-676(-)
MEHAPSGRLAATASAEAAATSAARYSRAAGRPKSLHASKTAAKRWTKASRRSVTAAAVVLLMAFCETATVSVPATFATAPPDSVGGVAFAVSNAPVHGVRGGGARAGARCASAAKTPDTASAASRSTTWTATMPVPAAARTAGLSAMAAETAATLGERKLPKTAAATLATCRTRPGSSLPEDPAATGVSGALRYVIHNPASGT